MFIFYLLWLVVLSFLYLYMFLSSWNQLLCLLFERKKKDDRKASWGFYFVGCNRMLSRQMTCPWRQQSTELELCLTDVRRDKPLHSMRSGGAGQRSVSGLFTGQRGATRTETCRGKRRRVRVTNFKLIFLIKVNARTASSHASCICWTTMTWSR